VSAALLVLVVLAGCSQFGVDGLGLRADRSLSITAPANRSRVTTPLHVEWTDTAPKPGGSYLVLIDRSPMPPGETVQWFAKGDADCATTPTCPDELYLARRGVTVATNTSVDIAIVPPLKGSRKGTFHELTIVRLDADGRRDGETADTTQFKVVTP
jgi:hypothetical protein